MLKLKKKKCVGNLGKVGMWPGNGQIEQGFIQIPQGVIKSWRLILAILLLGKIRISLFQGVHFHWGRTCDKCD